MVSSSLCRNKEESYSSSLLLRNCKSGAFFFILWSSFPGSNSWLFPLLLVLLLPSTSFFVDPSTHSSPQHDVFSTSCSVQLILTDCARRTVERRRNERKLRPEALRSEKRTSFLPNQPLIPFFVRPFLHTNFIQTPLKCSEMLPLSLSLNSLAEGKKGSWNHQNHYHIPSSVRRRGHGIPLEFLEGLLRACSSSRSQMIRQD